MTVPPVADLLIVGGGINGVGIARDAAGRGLSVVLAERDDLGAHTSSASSKLIHGGLRYLEQYQFRLVSEALAEREVLLNAAPHLVRPMRFVMPHVPTLRPAWMIRAGLLLYDYLSRRHTLPGSHGVDLRERPYSSGLRGGFSKGYVYSDCQVDDARLVVANARAAAEFGATIHTRTACVTAQREGAIWHAVLRTAQGTEHVVRARSLVNVTGPWVKQFLVDVAGLSTDVDVRLVQGSHIVVPRLYDGEHAYILQNDDRRVVFAYPYEGRYTLIGTTDVALPGAPGCCEASAAEIAYLCRATNRYFERPPAPADVIWSYSGIRPLFDDGSANPSQVTRDYVLHVHGADTVAPLLSVFGGKITTYRKLAEHALDRLRPWFPEMRAVWTAGTFLPGGDLGGRPLDVFATEILRRAQPWLPESLALALVRRHGADAPRIVAGACSLRDLGLSFGADLYSREIDHFIEREWALTGEDVLWRRTKAGLHLQSEQKQRITEYVAARASVGMR